MRRRGGAVASCEMRHTAGPGGGRERWRRLARGLARAALALAALASLGAWDAADARAQAEGRRDGPGIEDPSGASLASLRRALDRTARGRGRTRLLFYGASHTSSDQFTGYLRARLRARFGDAGHGFVLPARPFPYYDRRDVRFASGGQWRTLRVAGRDRPVDAYGLGGVALESEAVAWAAVEPRARTGDGSRVGRFELWYLRRPGGGAMELWVDGRLERVVSSAGARSAAHEVLEVRDGFHGLEVRTVGDGPVRLFGIVMERARGGVIVDSLGIPGARVRDQLPWDESVRGPHLARRDPDLVVLGYGTNESGNDALRIDTYEAQLSEVISRIRGAVPRASCLLIGPSERPRRLPDGGWAPREVTGRIVQAQRRVAAAHGCAFFDLVGFQGGPGRMHAWVASDPPLALADHVHFTEAGHRLLAEALEQALVAEPVRSRGRRLRRRGDEAPAPSPRATRFDGVGARGARTMAVPADHERRRPAARDGHILGPSTPASRDSHR